MKKLGMGKKEKSAEEATEDSKRSLFSKSSKSKSPAPATNPYAVPQNNLNADPYARPGPQQNPGGLERPPVYQSGGYSGIANDVARTNKSPVPPGGYGGGPRYGNTGYGDQVGYGGDRFGGISSASTSNSRPGGYGGLGGADLNAPDPNREALFAGAKSRVEQRDGQHAPQQSSLPPENSQPRGGYGMESQGYGPYEERQLTAEEEEEEDVEATKQEMRAMKQQDVSSTRNALRLAAQAEESGRGTLERLGAQGERIHNTEKNLDLAANQNREAEAKAREIKHLNRSMWAMQVNNPFTKSRRKAERDQAILDQHRMERGERDATRAAAWASQNRQVEAARKLDKPQTEAQKQQSLAERSKYQFEADSEDEAMEDEIDQNLDMLHGAAKRLHTLGTEMGREVDVQNKHIDRIGDKSEKVDEGILMNRARLDRIH